ncbi:MAG: lipopolysaccharide biosynthesis protein [Gammaproteobacteria bacterium]
MDTQGEKTASLRDYMQAIKRRRKWLIIIVTTGMLAAILMAMLLPAHYRSMGTILIEQQEMPADMVRSTVTSFADERVQVISRRVMTTQTLLEIIKRYDLYPKERVRDSREKLLERMRNDIGLKMISADVIDPRSGRPTSATIAFEVSYTSRSADLAAKVANQLSTLYLDENLSTRAKLAGEASSFLGSEGDRISRQIAESEAKLATFKEKHFDSLPELTQLNMQLLDRTDQQLREAEMRQSSLEQQRVFLEAQLAQLKPNSQIFSETGEKMLSASDRLKMARSALAGARARYAPGHPDIERLQREVAGLEGAAGPTTDSTNDLRRDLQRAQAELAQARERYAPDHPDIGRLQREVSSLDEQLRAAPAPVAAPVEAPVPTDSDNPAYVQIEAQVSATLNDLAALKSRIVKLRTQMADYQRKISLSPQIEQQYRELNRDYDNARLKYQEVRSKQMEAQTAQNLEADRKGERFTLIEPPLAPEEPVSPNRPMIFIAGLVMSLALGVGIVWLLETLDTTIRSRRDLLQIVGVAPLALVPRIGTLAETIAGKRRRLYAAGAAFATVGVAVVLAHLFYRPLDVLWFALARRFGL